MLSSEHMKVLGQYIIKLAIPCLLVVSISLQDFKSLIQIPYLASYGIASLLIFLATLGIYYKLYRENLTQASVMSMGASMSNTVYMGSGILYLFIGEKTAIYFAMTFLIENFLILLLFLICLELGDKSKPVDKIVQSCCINILKNPIVIALMIGILMSCLNIRFPGFVEQILKPIGQTATPLGLLVIGGSFYGITLSKNKKIARDILTVASLKLGRVLI